MPAIFTRLQVAGASFLAWFRERLSPRPVIIFVETDEDTKPKRKVYVNSSRFSLRLHSHDVGQLKEKHVEEVFEAYPHSTTVRSIIITQHQALTSIPTSIAKFTDITTLDLSLNSLSDLPWSVMFLRVLTVLDLSNNYFRSLPPVLGHLITLKQLFLDDNNLQNLPTSLLQLKQLQLLSVSGNEEMIAPPLEVCQQGTEAIMNHLQKRIGRSNMWRNSTKHYKESDTGTYQEFVEMKSLLEACIATVLRFKINYLSQAHLAPPLKRCLHERSKAELEAVKISKCSRCQKYFSTQAHFDGHDCR